MYKIFQSFINYIYETIIIYSKKLQILKSLCNLNKEELAAYFNSYNEIFNDNTMISTLDDFKNNKPPSRFVIQKDIKPCKYTANCYSILKDLCALGNVKKMYISKCIDSNVGVIENQLLHEQEIAKNLFVTNGTLLEIGCGCGRISNYISNLTNSRVYGINIDNEQLDDAKKYAKKTSNIKTTFLFKDLNDSLPFENETFDGIYTVQGLLTWIDDFDKVFKELHRILKPGGRIIIIDAVILDNFDKKNSHHLNTMKKARTVMRGGNYLHYKYIEDFSRKAGFNIISSKGGVPPNEASELPLVIKEDKHYVKIEKFIYILTKLHILPNYMPGLLTQLRYGIDDFIELLEKNLLTTIWEFILEKPE